MTAMERLEGRGAEEGRTATSEVLSRRVDSVDLLRGFVIVLMVLDHTREFFHVAGFDPTDPARTNAALFATRWVTHLCAPTFVFLAGASIRLQLSRKGAGPLSCFLVKRGLWLIAMEVTVISFGFNFAEPFLFLQVIWAIGVGMILMSALVWLPARVTLVLGCAIIAGHQLLAASIGMPTGLAKALWTLLMAPGAPPLIPGLVAYPVIPWFGIMALGYGLGGTIQLPAAVRRPRVLLTAVTMLACFLCMRALNGYGDPRPWMTFDAPTRTAFSFFNVSKYPPSLLYVLVTLGVALLVSLMLEALPQRLSTPLLVYGRTPFFTYLLHVYALHTWALLLGVVRGIPSGAFAGYLSDPARLAGWHWGISLTGVYVVWALALAMLFWPARWFAALKQTQSTWWLRYL